MLHVAENTRVQSVFLDKFASSMQALLDAILYAEDTQSTKWDFAVEMQRLEKLGLTETELRWLVKKGYVEHAQEVTDREKDGRVFRQTGNLSFAQATCFVLTDAGIATTRNVTACNVTGAKLVTETACDFSRRDTHHRSDDVPNGTPSWNPDTRNLRFAGKLVKRFRWPAMNQEAVLNAFQEEGWPDRIDDPLRPQPEQCPKRRLADTIKCLNRKQLSNLVHFHGDGTGEGVLWQTVVS